MVAYIKCGIGRYFSCAELPILSSRSTVHAMLCMYKFSNRATVACSVSLYGTP
jgi:hypothetical protein